jgi:hypothetical protein
MASACKPSIAVVSLLTTLTLGATNSAAAVKSISHTSVAIIGQIVEGDAGRLAKALGERRRAGYTDLTVYLNSPGGNLREGLAAAEAISEAAANVVVGENETCASACFLLFLAGNFKAIFPVQELAFTALAPKDKRTKTLNRSQYLLCSHVRTRSEVCRPLS